MTAALDSMTDYALVPAEAAHAAATWELVRDSGALDLNSPYAYLLLFAEFGDTSRVALTPDGEVAGFVAALRPPRRPNTVFVWQVGVAAAHRGQGLARRLIQSLLASVDPPAEYLEASVTPDNQPSQRLFRSVARAAGAICDEGATYLDAALFPAGAHQPEQLFRIGPLPVPFDNNHNNDKA